MSGAGDEDIFEARSGDGHGIDLVVDQGRNLGNAFDDVGDRDADLMGGELARKGEFGFEGVGHNGEVASGDSQDGVTGIAAEGVGRSFGDDTTLVEDCEGIAFLGFFEEMCRHEDGDLMIFSQVAQSVPEIESSGGIETGAWFIEQQ